MKKNMKFLFLLILTVLFSTFTYATGSPEPADDDKPGVIRGIVIDESSDEPMGYANIAVYSKSDSSLVTGGITNEEGEFEINEMTWGEYYLVANFIGFEKEWVDNIILDKSNPRVEVGKISLSPSTHELGSVEVVADKAAIEYKLDKKVVNVSQVISATGGTAVDVLENTPSVEVDIDGNVSLRGSSNFTVLIDGRPSVLSGSDALRQIPASALENIEIITNPSAKYEPDGMAGIINLVMKKNSMNGINGIVNLSAGTGDKYNGDFTLNYRTEKYNLFFGADLRHENYTGERESTRETWMNDTTEFLIMSGSRNDLRSSQNFKTGIDLYLSEKSTFTLSGEIGKSENEQTGDGKTRAYTLPSSTDLYSVNEEISARNNSFYSGNASFQHNFNNSGHKLDVMAFYSEETGDDTEEENEILANSQYVKTNQYLDRVSTLETEKEKEFRFKLDYTWPFSKQGRLEAGLQSRLESEIESMTFKDFDIENNTWVDNDLYTSSTDFRRDIHAAYSTFSNKLGGFEFMAGLRGELTIREIINTKREYASTLNRFDLFPTLHLSFPVRENNELMASYSRRINRPGGRELDPSPNYMNRYMIWLGNPDLLPEYTDSYEIGAMKRFGKSYASLDAFHRVTHNKIDMIQTLGEDGIITMMSDNFDNDYSTGLEFTGNINFTEWLLVNGSVSMYHYRISGELNGDAFDRESTNWSGRLNTTFKFADNSRMQITGFYRGPSVSAQGESKSMIFTNISYRHEFFDKKLSATLSVRDPLGTAKFERESYGENFKSWFRMQREPRVVMLTLSYKINNFREERQGGSEGGDGGMNMGGEMF